MKKVKAEPVSIEHKTLLAQWDNYKGKIVAVAGNKVFAAKTGKQAQKMIREIEKTEHKPPLVTYIPKKDAFHFFGV